MEKEVLETVLKKSVFDSSINRIIDMQIGSALPKGENYTSAILKLTMKVVTGNGRIARKSFIAKKENTGKAAKHLSNDYQLFKMEAWASGFKTVKRTEAQDINHARLVLRSLGRYHAMAKVLEERGIVSKDDYKPYSLLFDEVYIRNFLYGGKLALIREMRASWGEEWAETAVKLSKMPLEELLKRIRNSGNFDDNTFKCLNHGDCWTNNMMFKYDWQGRPIEVRFIDYQIPHYNSPCVDVTYFMYTSIQPCVRRQNYKSLIELYHESLVSSLYRFGYQGSSPNLEDIERAMERLGFFGLTLFSGYFPVFTCTTTDAMDLDEIFESKGEVGINGSIYKEEGIIAKLGEDLKKLVKMEGS